MKSLIVLLHPSEIEKLKRMLEMEREKVKEQDATIQQMKTLLSVLPPEASYTITPPGG